MELNIVFHEVRVPLNTALLAVQNLEGEQVFRSIDPDQKEMLHGLKGSLTMMEKVLNDVLSFNRMESGKVCSTPPPQTRPLSAHCSLLKLANHSNSTGPSVWSSWPIVDKLPVLESISWLILIRLLTRSVVYSWAMRCD